MNQQEWELFYKVFEGMPRSGPGNNELTRKAYSYVENVPLHPQILDIGCGQGVQTIELAKVSHGMITAIDNHQAFLDILKRNARAAALDRVIHTVNVSMERMPFEKESFDIIWSEGALYQMGFANGLRTCYDLLKKGGNLAVTEAVYFQEDQPQAVIDFWAPEYPAITTVENNLSTIAETGFVVLAHFPLPRTAWIESFYNPMGQQLAHLKKQYHGIDWAQRFLKTMHHEIEVYKQYSDTFGYEFFIMQKPLA
jgi:ubiquinone/menaquinone biosynthesis C-methylase UbiE